MSFVLAGLDPAPFRPLYGADPATLATARAIRRVADCNPGFPCRVTLRHLRAGDEPAGDDEVNSWAMSKELLERYRAEILRVAIAHGARAVCVFGSLARDEGEEESDLDLLVDLEPGRSLLDLIAIEQDLEDLLGRPVDVVTRRALSPYLRKRVIAEAVPL